MTKKYTDEKNPVPSRIIDVCYFDERQTVDTHGIGESRERFHRSGLFQY